MCGLCGFIDPSKEMPAQELRSLAQSMCNRIMHRGPDAHGVWADPDFGLALGHRRLSIIELSDAGAQPMTSASGRYVIIFNGEIYNFRELAAILAKENKAPAFRGHSDTEVMLAAFDAWGVADSLARFNGMFAFAVWDRREKKLFAGRDRCGKKPLYYGWNNGVFLFGSELKSLCAHPKFSASINMSALSFFLSNSYVPSPLSIYEGICKLPQASYFVFGEKEMQQKALPQTVAYWNAEDAFSQARANSFKGTSRDACDKLEELLVSAVKLRMVADVPLGAFLSGGIDSSLVTALMQKVSPAPVKTFTIGFPGEPFDEAGRAADIARHLGTNHTEIPVTARDALDVVPRLPEMYDEPFADDSQVPTWLVCKHSRNAVTVALSGDGGDELFAGYESYRRVRRYFAKLSLMPAPILRAASLAFGGVGRLGSVQEKLAIQARRQAQKLGFRSFEQYYQWYMSYNKTRDRLLALDAQEPSTALSLRRKGPVLDRMRITDFQTFLSDDVLAKVDRASMNVSLEVRCPLLDPAIIDFAWSLGEHSLMSDTTGKLPLREVLYRHVPRSIVDRPKASFGMPVSQWLKRDLAGWAQDLLSEQRLKSQGIFLPEAVATLWRQHASGTWDWGRLLWNILMFQSWHSLYRRG